MRRFSCVLISSVVPRRRWPRRARGSERRRGLLSRRPGVLLHARPAPRRRRQDRRGDRRAQAGDRARAGVRGAARGARRLYARQDRAREALETAEAALNAIRPTRKPTGSSARSTRRSPSSGSRSAGRRSRADYRDASDRRAREGRGDARLRHQSRPDARAAVRQSGAITTRRSRCLRTSSTTSPDIRRARCCSRPRRKGPVRRRMRIRTLETDAAKRTRSSIVASSAWRSSTSGSGD